MIAANVQTCHDAQRDNRYCVPCPEYRVNVAKPATTRNSKELFAFRGRTRENQFAEARVAMILSRRGRTFQVGEVQLLVRMEKTMVSEFTSAGRM